MTDDSDEDEIREENQAARRKTFYEYSGKASDVSRQLAFAGLAFIWLFKAGGANEIRLPPGFLWPLCFLAFALAADLCQYAYAATAWGILHLLREKYPKPEALNILGPRWINVPTTWIFFTGKLVCVGIAYVLILIALWGRIAETPSLNPSETETKAPPTMRP